MSSKKSYKSRLLQALINNDKEVLLRVLRQGADVNMIVRINPAYPTAPELYSLLMLAAWKSDIALIKILIDHGADVQITVQDRTALYEAVQRGNAGILRLLLEHGADVNDRGEHGTAYLQVADAAFNTYQISTYDPDVENILREYGAKLVAVLSDAQVQEALDALQKEYVIHCDICRNRLDRKKSDQRWHLFCPEGCTDVYWPKVPSQI
jgi:ankyrin repeat protein